jgi:glycosyltransferase involved in cell wall biosynthesis
LKISVITPTYNQGCYIRKSIDSVLNQKGNFQLEHIVVDGGSTDETLSILRSYGDKISWTSGPDGGQADALNKGIAKATGDIIGWLNSDDLYEPRCLQTICEIFGSEPSTQWVYGKTHIIDEKDNEYRKWITFYKNLRMRHFSLGKLLTEDWIPQMSVFWRRSAGEVVGPFRKELRYAMDYDYWLRLGAKWPGRYVNHYLANFRLHSFSKSGRDYIKQLNEAYRVAVANAHGQYRWALFWHRFYLVRTISIYRVLDLLSGTKKTNDETNENKLAA